MKVRLGFVSNSSSASFSGIGVMVDRRELEEVLIEMLPDQDKEEIEDDTLPILHNYIKPMGLDSEFIFSDDYVPIGIRVEAFKEYPDKTISELVELAQEKIDRAFNKKFGFVDFFTFEGAAP